MELGEFLPLVSIPAIIKEILRLVRNANLLLRKMRLHLSETKVKKFFKLNQQETIYGILMLNGRLSQQLFNSQ